jgi:hypothetical protein
MNGQKIHIAEIERLNNEVSQLKAIQGQLEVITIKAHQLICWTHQYAINCEEMPARGWWHVKDLHPGVWNKLNTSEQALYDVLIKLQPIGE